MLNLFKNMIPENAGSKPAFFITKDFVLNINKIIAMKEMEPEKGVVFKETEYLVQLEEGVKIIMSEETYETLCLYIMSLQK